MTYRRPRSDTVLLIFTAALVVYLVLTPLGMLIWNSFKTKPPGVPVPLTLDNFINAYLDPTLYPLVANSFLYATGSTVFAFFIAFTRLGVCHSDRLDNHPGHDCFDCLAYALTPSYWSR